MVTSVLETEDDLQEVFGVHKSQDKPEVSNDTRKEKVFGPKRND